MPEYYDSDDVEDEDRVDADPEPESPPTPLTVPKSTRTRPRATPHSWPHHICAFAAFAIAASDRAPDAIRPNRHQARPQP
jgi:hypothetical protein